MNIANKKNLLNKTFKTFSDKNIHIITQYKFLNKSREILLNKVIFKRFHKLNNIFSTKNRVSESESEKRNFIMYKLSLRSIKYAIGNINQSNSEEDNNSCSNNSNKSKTYNNEKTEVFNTNDTKNNKTIIKNYNDIVEEDEIKFTSNPYLNKQVLIQNDKKEKERFNHTVNNYLIKKLNHEHIEGLEVSEVLDLIAKMLEAENNNSDLWYKLLNQFNDLLCSHRVAKKDILNFLELLNFFKPKILEKKILPKDLTQIGSQIAFSKRHEEEYHKLTQPKDIFGQFALHLKKNLNSNVISKLFDLKPKFENRENIEENFDDLLGLYSTLFRNIEQKIIDDIAVGRVAYSHSDCVTLIKSFACAQEGTNMFYELLMRKIIKHFQELTLHDLEILLNYLPHELYDNKEFEVESSGNSSSGNSEEKYVEMGRTKSVSEFYANVYDKVLENLTSADSQLFLNLFQGCLRIKFVDVDVIGAYLLEFDRRLDALIKAEENTTYTQQENSSIKIERVVEKSQGAKNFVLSFLQILTYFIRNDIEEKFVELIDFEILWKSIYENFIVRNIESFALKEISTIFWVMYHFRSVSSLKISLFEPSIKRILLGYINDPKANIDTMGYETHLRYYNNHNIDPYDIEALMFFVESNKAYKGELLGLFQKALRCINLENTHPISRGLFGF